MEIKITSKKVHMPLMIVLGVMALACAVEFIRGTVKKLKKQPADG